jgi:hypothetical protein
MTSITMLMGEAGSGAQRPIPPPPPSHASLVISLRQPAERNLLHLNHLKKLVVSMLHVRSGENPPGLLFSLNKTFL